MADAPKLSPFRNGLACRCPRCGQGKLFQGFLDLRPRCDVCGLDYRFADAGDGPAVFVVFLAGAIVVACALIVEFKFEPPIWVHAAAVGTAHSGDDDVAAAADEGPDDRAAVSPQGRGRPAGMSSRSQGHADPKRVRACGPDRAARPRHLAARSQGLEGGVDRHARIISSRPRRSIYRRRASGVRWTQDNSEFTRVRLRAEFSGAGDALVYTSGSQVRDDVKGTGYFVFSPARLAGGGQVAINRGYSPSRTNPAPSGPQDIIGALRWPEAPSWFASRPRRQGRDLDGARSAA